VHHFTGLEAVEIAVENGARTVIVRDSVEDRETVQALADLAEARERCNRLVHDWTR
jgi:thiamine monophosphate synthase